MDLLRNLRLSTRLLFLYEVTTSRHSRLRTIAERLGMTVQGASEYAHGLEADGLLALSGGEYRATKKGVEFLHDRLHELRDFVDRAGKEMAFVETTAAFARTAISKGARVGLFMEDGFLVAYGGRSSPSSGVAVRDAAKGDVVRNPIVAAMDVVGHVAAKELGLTPRIEFGVLPASVEAAELGLDVMLVLPEERAAEAIRAIEEANKKLEDQIPFESVTLG
ncbi:MAG: hypothetical protein E6K19_03530 [Methanobacteriota archaeon]|nr:MAG: hypothetical protein E6K19_03530 [Euryarchaeota archaeon]